MGTSSKFFASQIKSGLPSKPKRPLPLMDIVFPAGDAGWMLFAHWPRFYPGPVIFISIRDDALAWLNAISSRGRGSLLDQAVAAAC
ncbi:MAG UNVERIFIED_CONTAM: hypothetical protein LVR29_21750 [Microcystis novacekii LVE1205-3]